MKSGAFLALFMTLAFSNPIDKRVSDKSERSRFFFSVYGGPGMERVKFSGKSVLGEGTMDIQGKNFGVGLMVGGALMRNFFFILEPSMGGLIRPKTKMQGVQWYNPDISGLRKTGFAIGLMYLMEPLDVFFCGSLGSGTFYITHELHEYVDIVEYHETTTGFSTKLRLGKDWSMAGHLHIGISAEYAYVDTEDWDGYGATYVGKFESHTYALRFHLTVN